MQHKVSMADTLSSSSYDTARSTLRPSTASVGASREEDLGLSHGIELYARRLRKKTRAIRLLSLFFTALAHELREEYGVGYPDYEGVLSEEDRRKWESSCAVLQPSHAGMHSTTGSGGEASSSGYDFSTLRSLAPDSMGTVKSMGRGRRQQQQKQQSEQDVEAGTTADRSSSATGWFRRRSQTPSAASHPTVAVSDADSGEATPLLRGTEPLPDAGASLGQQEGSSSFQALPIMPPPSLALYSLHQLSLYLTAARASGMLDLAGPAGFNYSNTLISSLTSAHASLHRIKAAAIPAAYGIHLKQCTAAYLLALPLTLVTELGWKVIPFVTLVAVTLLGVVGINGELEVPFGDDASDHNLGLFCAAFRGEIELLVRGSEEGVGDKEEICG